ncbi:MAG: DNA-3-methyladenine glycosylase 2 family protein [Pseudonocardia sp.]
MSDSRENEPGPGGSINSVPLDQDRCYRAVAARDPRFDGQFVTAVRTTGIYCRPSCPAVTPKRANVEFLVTAGAAQLRGYRACRRCLPDAVPGSPEWNCRADLAARAMRLISDGLVERAGVPGLATRLGYSERHLNRVLTEELGAGPLALARAHRAHTARLLVETTAMGMADVAFAAGFASVRQFNDTVRAVYGVTPSTLRAEAGRRPRARSDGARRGTDPVRPAVTGALVLRLPFRAPLDAAGLLGFLAARAVAGVESVRDGYRRTLRLPHGAATVTLDLPGAATGGSTGDPSAPAHHAQSDRSAPTREAPGHLTRQAPGAPTREAPGHRTRQAPGDPAGHGARADRPRRGGRDGAHVVATLRLADPRDLGPAVHRLRRLLDLDADPFAVDAVLATDPVLAPSVAATPGIRLPGTVDPAETALRAVLGQQVSVAAARTAAARLAAALGERLPPSLAGPGRAPSEQPEPSGAGPAMTAPSSGDDPDLLFPTPDAVAARGAEILTGPARRTATVLALADALATGALVLDAGRDPARLRAELVALPGIGPWTAGYLAMRVLGDPDELLADDLAVRRGAAALDLPRDAAALTARAARWRPWRSYAAMHLWAAAATRPATSHPATKERP